MAASFLLPLPSPKPFLSTPKTQVTTTITIARCTTTPQNPKTEQETNTDPNPNPNPIPDEETPPSATATTSFAVAKRIPSLITPGSRRRSVLSPKEPPNFEIGWKRTKEIKNEKPRGWAIADFLDKLEGLMARGRFGSVALLGTVAAVVAERAREETEVLVAEGGVEERLVTELYRVLRLVEMDVEMVKAAVKEETMKERVETARARCRQAILVALSL